MNNRKNYKDFVTRLQLLAEKRSDLIITTLSNIFTMRLIGNKTHGDLAEIAISEFINQYMYDFRSVHVGKDLYRAKSQEEDIKIINEITKAEFPVSLKAYGNGPLQLSTDKNFGMFPRLEKAGNEITNKNKIAKILKDPAFSEFYKINILPLIYDEENHKCNILVFDCDRAIMDIAHIVKKNQEEAENIRFINLIIAMAATYAKYVTAGLALTRYNEDYGRIQKMEISILTVLPMDGLIILIIKLLSNCFLMRLFLPNKVIAMLFKKYKRILRD